MKVIAQKEKHVVASITSGEKGVTTTVLVAMSAISSFIPPMLIFKRKRMKDSFLDNAQLGTTGGYSVIAG